MERTLTLAERLVRSTVRIDCFSNHQYVSGGTGFFVDPPKQRPNERRLFLVSNRHILCAPEADYFRLFLRTYDGMRTQIEPIFFYKHSVVSHPFEEVDLAAVDITPYCIVSNPLDYVPISMGMLPENWEMLDAIEDIIMIGYPDLKIGADFFPIVRKGNTATSLQHKYLGMDRFLADIPVFGGSSGSPIFIYSQGSRFERHPDGSMTNTLGMPQALFVGIQSGGYKVPNELVGPDEKKVDGVTAKTFMNLAVVEKSNQLSILLEQIVGTHPKGS